MSYETESFTDIIRLTTSTGRVPDDIPAHYWFFCWRMRRKARGNKAPTVDIWSAARRGKPIQLKYTP